MLFYYSLEKFTDVLFADFYYICSGSVVLDCTFWRVLLSIPHSSRIKAFKSPLKSHLKPESLPSGWFICNFGVLGKSFREVFWSCLTCFSDNYRSTFGTNFRKKS